MDRRSATIIRSRTGHHTDTFMSIITRAWLQLSQTMNTTRAQCTDVTKRTASCDHSGAIEGACRARDLQVHRAARIAHVTEVVQSGGTNNKVQVAIAVCNTRAALLPPCYTTSLLDLLLHLLVPATVHDAWPWPCKQTATMHHYTCSLH